jgi:hypothetical protein
MMETQRDAVGRNQFWLAALTRRTGIISEILGNIVKCLHILHIHVHDNVGVFNCLQQCALHTRTKMTAVHFAHFPHGYVEAVLFTEHFTACYFPRGFTIFG